MDTLKNIVFLAFGMLSAVALSGAQTQCSVKVPVPDLNYCDAAGLLEEHVDAHVHETRGRVQAVQDYQRDTFKLFDQQFTVILNESTNTDVDIRDVEEHIVTLKRVFNTFQSLQATTEQPQVFPEVFSTDEPEVGSRRQKRAAPTTTNPTQQALDSAKAAFQQQLASITQKLQNIASSIANDVAQSTAYHTKLQTMLATNQQYLTTTEQQIKLIDTAVMNALKSKTIATGGGPSLSGVTQEVTDLIINATVAEQIIQRQLDDLGKQENQMEASERFTATRLSTFAKDLTDFDQRLTNDTQQISNLKGAVQIYEDQIGQFVYNKTNDVSDLRAQLGPVQAQISQVGRTVFNATLELGRFEADLKAYKREVDSMQSLVSFSKQAQQRQSGDILQLKKTLSDDFQVMKYAFGLTTTPP